MLKKVMMRRKDAASLAVRRSPVAVTFGEGEVSLSQSLFIGRVAGSTWRSKALEGGFLSRMVMNASG
jgi:hypothetical protein